MVSLTVKHIPYADDFIADIRLLYVVFLFEDVSDILEQRCGLLPNLLAELEKIQQTTPLCAEEKRPRSCLELLNDGHTMSGVYEIYPKSWTQPIKVGKHFSFMLENICP